MRVVATRVMLNSTLESALVLGGPEVVSVKWTATKLASVNLRFVSQKLSACNQPLVATRTSALARCRCPDGSSPSRLVRDGSATTTTPPAATG
jgi:hypothetical protein